MSKQNVEQAKKIYERLRKDDESMLFNAGILTNNRFKELKKTKYKKDKEFLNFVVKLENKSDVFKKNVIPAKAVFVKQKRDRSTLYSFDSPFQILHEDAAILGFLVGTQWIHDTAFSFSIYSLLKSICIRWNL